MKFLLKSIRSKQILISGLMVLVVIAGYYRWTVDRQPETVPTITNKAETKSEQESKPTDKTEEQEYGDYFARARYDRDCARSEASELLAVSAQNGEQSEEIAEKNAKRLEMYAKNMEDETTIENMVIAKGYSDCVAFVDEDSVKVVVKSDELQAEGVAQIKDIVMEQTGVKATNIKISSKAK